MTGSPGRRPSIAVVGGGASAALLLACLAREAGRAAPCDVTVFDRTGRFVRGVAYGTKRLEHLLNVRAERMSAFESEPGHFADWLAAGGHPFGPGDFAPRALYGTYLEDVFARAADGAAAAGWRVALKTEDVSTPPRADVVVTATGNAFPVAPRGADGFSADEGYHADPFAVDYGALAAAGGSVALLGTGLSMVDAAVSLHLAGFRGRITAISRRGLLPSRHAAPCAWPPFFGPGRFPETAREALEAVRREVARARAAGVPWQAVIDSLRPVTNEIWTNWSGAERRRFARLLPYWNVHRHRMPPSSADIVDLMMRGGILAVRKGRIEGISRRDGVFSVDCGAGGAVSAGRIINCLGYRPAAADGVPGGCALGPALSGVLLETTAIPEIRAQAAVIARGIAARFPAPGAAV